MCCQQLCPSQAVPVGPRASSGHAGGGESKPWTAGQAQCRPGSSSTAPASAGRRGMSPIHQFPLIPRHPSRAWDAQVPSLLSKALHKGCHTSTRSLGRGDHSPVVVLEKLLIDSMGQGETGCHQPDDRDAQSSLCQGHPLLQWVQDDLQQRLIMTPPTGSKSPHSPQEEWADCDIT